MIVTLNVPEAICDKFDILAKRFGTTSHDLMVEALQEDIEECEQSWGKGEKYCEYMAEKEVEG